MKLHDDAAAPLERAETFDTIEAGFSGFDAPALDIGPADAPESSGRVVGLRSGRVREHGVRTFAANALAALGCDGPA